MYCEELELSRLAIYQVMDYLVGQYYLIKHDKKHFTLSNGRTYKIKFIFGEYVNFKYHSIFGDVGLNNDNCDFYVFVYPINDRMIYRHDFVFYLLSTDEIINLIKNKKYICDVKGFMTSKYKFTVKTIFSSGVKLTF